MQCRRNYTLTALVIVLPLLGALKADANGDACIVAVEMECAKDFHAKWCQRVDFQFQCPHVKQEITWGGSIKWYLAEPAGGPPRSHVGILGPWVSGLHPQKKVPLGTVPGSRSIGLRKLIQWVMHGGPHREFRQRTSGAEPSRHLWRVTLVHPVGSGVTSPFGVSAETYPQIRRSLSGS